MTLEIGQKVYWQIGSNLATGLFKQIDERALAEVICTSVGNKDAKMKVYIEPSIFVDKTDEKQTYGVPA